VRVILFAPENVKTTNPIDVLMLEANTASDVARGEPVGKLDVPKVPECAYIFA
jgi:hypothetical protein